MLGLLWTTSPDTSMYGLMDSLSIMMLTGLQPLQIAWYVHAACDDVSTHL